MADWAIVIGVDKYLIPNASLRGAVCDALEMRRWLIEEGRVPEENIALLLAPDTEPVSAGIEYLEPTYENIITSIDSTLMKSGARGDRLFFHYSGHGLTVRPDYVDEEALLCSNFTKALTTYSLSLSSILHHFAATEFAEQFFFIDACRNMPWKHEFHIGRIPRPRTRDSLKPPVQQFVLFATSPRLEAVEEPGENGDAQGAFTSSLLAGLRGAGKAKVWDRRDEEYVVRFDQLFRFIVADVLEKQINVGNQEKVILQLPRTAGERGGITGNDPVLARFNEAAFPNETLRIHIEPFEASTGPVLIVQRESTPVDKKEGITEIPVEFSLRPREYRIRASASGFSEREKRGWWVELWGPQELRVELVARTDDVLETVLTRSPPASADGTVYSEGFGAYDDMGLESLGSQPEATIELFSQDELAPLELYDSAGILLAHGNGSVRQTVWPGIYRGVMRLPGVPPVTVIIPVNEGEKPQVGVNAPSPSRAVAELIRSGRYHVEKDNTVLVSETSGAGPIAGLHLSTILTMAGGVLLLDPVELDAYHLRNLGLQALDAKTTAEGGVMLLVADEIPEKNFVQRARIRLLPIDGPVKGSHSLLPIQPTIGQYSTTAAPGSYWLAFEPPEQPPLISLVTIPSGRVCMIVLSRAADGNIQMFQYLPPTNGGFTAQPRYLRRLEMIQRFYSEGALQRAYELIEPNFVEPIAGCLGGYLLLRLGRSRELDISARSMTTHFPDVPDSWILRAEHKVADGKETEAKSAYRRALDLGIPLVAEGVARLREATERFGIDHQRCPLLNRIWQKRVRSLIWTSWLPGQMCEGERLTG